MYRKLALPTIVALLFNLSTTFCFGNIDETPVKEFSGINFLNQEKIDIKISQAGKATVIVFVSARCPCSLSHEPVLIRLAREFGPHGFQFIGVHSNADESEDFARREFLRRGNLRGKHFPFPLLNDPDSKIANQFEAFKTPHVYVVDPRGKVLFQGGVDDVSELVLDEKLNIDETNYQQSVKRQFLRDALLDVQATREPAEKKVRVLGCVINRP